MLGTLNGALEVRGIQLDPEAIAAAAEGKHDVVDGVIRLMSIDVTYTLRIPAGSRETVDRALARHQDKCPMAASLGGAIAISWRAEIEEGGAEV